MSESEQAPCLDRASFSGLDPDQGLSLKAHLAAHRLHVSYRYTMNVPSSGRGTAVYEAQARVSGRKKGRIWPLRGSASALRANLYED